MPFGKDDKDEIRKIVATEIRDFVKSAVSAALNRPVDPAEGRYAMSGEGRREREAQNKLLQQFGTAIIKAAEANLREADARIVEKTDPKRAEVIRNLVPEW